MVKETSWQRKRHDKGKTW